MPFVGLCWNLVSYYSYRATKDSMRELERTRRREELQNLVVFEQSDFSYPDDLSSCSPIRPRLSDRIVAFMLVLA
jgi:hypothetical protein